jgi:hypothetical protein
VTLNLSG